MKINFHVNYEWETVMIKHNKPYFFPASISKFMKEHYKGPEIYRWVVKNYDKINSVYIGEAEILCPRRIQGYLKPGPSQMTNIRMNKLLHKFMNDGMKIGLERLNFSDFSIENKIITRDDLANKSLRLILENFMILNHENQGIKILNKIIKK